MVQKLVAILIFNGEYFDKVSFAKTTGKETSKRVFLKAHSDKNTAKAISKGVAHKPHVPR